MAVPLIYVAVAGGRIAYSFLRTPAGRKAAQEFGCSEASAKSWRYGYRKPTVNQAKQILRATDGRLDFESIFGSVSDILEKEEA